jgi:hypothetical protein
VGKNADSNFIKAVLLPDKNRDELRSISAQTKRWAINRAKKISSKKSSKK